MKYLILYFGLFFSIVNCQEKKTIKKTNMEQKVKKEEIVYTIKISAANPFELRLNDVLISKKN